MPVGVSAALPLCLVSSSICVRALKNADSILAAVQVRFIRSAVSVILGIVLRSPRAMSAGIAVGNMGTAEVSGSFVVLDIVNVMCLANRVSGRVCETRYDV